VDVNDRARERWRAETDGFDRVRSVLATAGDPVSAADVAADALVTEKTARKHLERLVELGFAASEQDGRTTRYRRDRDDEVSRRVRELAAEHSRSELLAGIERMREELAAYRERFDAETPEEYVLDSDGSEDWTALHDWEGTRRNLALAQAALAYGRARDLAEA
jgi:predicted ArsR family transcriptional regulator